jgi:putative flippase GtrA
MSVETPRDTAGGRYSGAYAEPHGDGWITFAGVMLMLAGVLNVIGGIAAIDDANVYVANAHYTFADLSTWGWIILLTGVVQVLAALGIWARNQFARWLGVGFAGLNAAAQLLMMPAFPLWSLALFGVDLLIIYGLVAYGSREAA